MALPSQLADRLRLPVMAAPMFIASGPDLVVAQCTGGIVGSFPSLNARPQAELDGWLAEIGERIAAYAARHPQAAVAPYAVNLIVHHSNARLENDLATCVRHRTPVFITSLASAKALPLADIVKTAHAYGGLVFHDVTSIRHAHKAAEAGVDGLVLVCAGAGGHAGTLSPFAFVNEVRRFWRGPLALSGSITHGNGIAAARMLGCDLAYIGTQFIATDEAQAQPAFKQMIVEANAADIVYTPLFSGVPANFLKASVRAAGLDPDNLPAPDGSQGGVADHESRPKAWKDVWSAGHGVGNIDRVEPTHDVIARLEREYRAALAAAFDGAQALAA